MVIVVGDTHLTQPLGEAAGLLQGAIKTRILTDTLRVLRGKPALGRDWAKGS
jgi:hypothetical protein